MFVVLLFENLEQVCSFEGTSRRCRASGGTGSQRQILPESPVKGIRGKDDCSDVLASCHEKGQVGTTGGVKGVSPSCERGGKWIGRTS